MRARRTCRSDLSTGARQNIHSPQQLFLFFYNETEDELLFFFPQPATIWFITIRYFFFFLSFQKALFYNSTDDLITGDPVLFIYFVFPMVRSMANKLKD